MKVINLVTNKTLAKGYKGGSEGVFKTARGQFIVKVKEANKLITIGSPFNTKEEALAEYTSYKAK